MASTENGSGGEGCGWLMRIIIRRGSDTHLRPARIGGVGVTGRRYDGSPGRVPRPLLIDKGLIGFDVGTGSDIVRPELLRLVNRGTKLKWQLH